MNYLNVVAGTEVDWPEVVTPLKPAVHENK